MSNYDQADKYFEQGKEYADQSRFKEAEVAFRKVIKINPIDGAAYTWLGHILEGDGRIKDAEHAFQQAINVEPLVEYHHSNLGTLLMKQDRLVEAEAAFRKALEINPMEDYLYFNLGVSLMKQNRLAEAEVAFRKVLEISPNDKAASEKLKAVLSQGYFEPSETNIVGIVQKEFRFENIDGSHPYDDPIPVFTVRQATPEDNQIRQDKLLELRNNYSGFISDGYKFAGKNRFFPWEDYMWRYFDYGNRDEDDYYVDYVDVAEHRFDWIIPRLEGEIRHIEIPLVLAACNLLSLNRKERLIEFQGGRFSHFNWTFYEHEEDQVYEKVLEMNPSWSGEFERTSNFLKDLTLPKNADLKQGNFKDLALKTAFVKNKSYLRSLMDEIKQDVFDNEGDIKLDMRLKPFRELAGKYWFIFRNSRPPFENLIYFPYPVNSEENIRSYFRRRPIPRSLPGEGSGLDFLISVLAGRASAHGRSEKEILPFGNYIGMLQNGNNEIRLIAQTTDYSDDGKFMYWDTFIDDTVPTLRTAIEWFTRKPKLIPDRNLDEDTGWMDEAQDFYSDMEDDAYIDDD